MRLTVGILLGLVAGASAVATLPPASDQEKAAAAEKKAKSAWADKVDAYKLCLAQDRIASAFRKGGAGSGSATATSAGAGGAAATSGGSGSAAPTGAGSGTVTPTSAGSGTATPTSAGSGSATQAASAGPANLVPTNAGSGSAVPTGNASGKGAAPTLATVTPCLDPGAYVPMTPVAQKPLEVSGAHSPAGTATSPPSTTTPAAEQKK